MSAGTRNPERREELKNGRDDWIRTSDLTHPKRARYQTALRPDRFRPAISVSPAFEKGQDSEKFFVQIEEEFALRARRWLAMSAACRRVRMIHGCFGRQT